MLTEWLGLGEPPPISVRQEIYPLCSANIASSDLLPTNSNNFLSQKMRNNHLYELSTEVRTSEETILKPSKKINATSI